MSGFTVLGIDPGTATTGYGVVREVNNKLETIDYGCIMTTPAATAAQRLLSIKEDLKKLLAKHKPAEVAVEQLFFNTNTKTAMSVGQARGVIIVTVAESGYPVAEYTPLQVKLAVTGNGRAEKHQVQQMVKQLLSLNETPKPDDAADALAIAICHLSSYKFNRLSNGASA